MNGALCSVQGAKTTFLIKWKGNMQKVCAWRVQGFDMGPSRASRGAQEVEIDDLQVRICMSIDPSRSNAW